MDCIRCKYRKYVHGKQEMKLHRRYVIKYVTCNMYIRLDWTMMKFVLSLVWFFCYFVCTINLLYCSAVDFEYLTLLLQYEI